jgi:hypothetical protein
MLASRQLLLLLKNNTEQRTHKAKREKEVNSTGW